MKRILKTACILAVAYVGISTANATPLVGAAVAGGVVGAVAMQNYMIQQPSTYVYYNTPSVVTTVSQPVAYTQTTTVVPGLTVRERTTYVQPAVTVVQPAPTVVYQTANPVVVVY